MKLYNAFTKSFNISLPVVGAPMAGVAGPELASAVARAGGLGLLGSGISTGDKIKAEIAAARKDQGDGGAVGIGLLNFCIKDDMLETTIASNPHTVWLAVGDFEPFMKPLKDAGIRVMCQVTTLEQVALVIKHGADAVVVQGNESGGHGASAASTLSFVPEAVDLAQQLSKSNGRSPVPIIAAGGICDARQIAACFVLGAQGVVLGTRLVATNESKYKDAKKQHIVKTGSQASEKPTTVRTTLYDELNEEVTWPSGITGRAIINDFTDDWDRQTPLQPEPLEQARQKLKAGNADIKIGNTWAGTSVGLITSVEPAQSLVEHLMRDAAAILKGTGLLEDAAMDLGICT